MTSFNNKSRCLKTLSITGECFKLLLTHNCLFVHQREFPIFSPLVQSLQASKHKEPFTLDYSQRYPDENLQTKAKTPIVETSADVDNHN
jgi:hypothetical protein